MALPNAVDLNGDPPSLAALQCEGFICQAFIYEGEVVETAQIVHMCFGGSWYRLYFDFGFIFWRASESPLPWEVEEEGWIYPLKDIGVSLGLVGKRLEYYKMEVFGPAAEVTFVFEGGPRIVFENYDDNTNFRVTNSD